MTDKPNILILFSDQQRWDTLGCYGQPLEVTPNLDRLASEGVLLEHAFSPQPVCGPTRACLQTGKYASEIPCTMNDVGLPIGEKTIAHWLSQAGYEVGYLGKWHLASDFKAPGVKEPYYGAAHPVPPERRGGYRDFWLASDVLEFTSHSYDGHMFDGEGEKREFPPGRYRVEGQTDWVLEYLSTRTRERPFFLFASYLEPHHQNDHKHYEGPRGSKERFKDFVPPTDLAGAQGDWREEYPNYLGCCHSLDENVGRIMAELARLGLEENTLVIYASDHGSHFRTRNSEYKRSCHEASIHVPLVARGPGFRGGRRVRELVSLMDLPPTLLEAGGVAQPPSFRGRPLQELAAGRAVGWPAQVFSQISESHCGRAVRTERWKYSVRAPEGAADAVHRHSPVYVEDHLYDLASDPHEQTNLVDSAACGDVRSDLADRLRAWMREIGEPEAEIQPRGG